MIHLLLSSSSAFQYLTQDDLIDLELLYSLCDNILLPVISIFVPLYIFLLSYLNEEDIAKPHSLS